MKCIIVDDDAVARTILHKYITTLGKVELIGQFENPMMALPFLKEEQVDLIFLDVEMPEMSGMDFLQVINESGTKVILTTSHTEHAIEAFQFNVSGYLVKPIKYNEFINAVKKVESQLQSLKSFKGNDTVFIKSDKAIVKLLRNDVKIIECKGDYVTIHTANKRHTIRSTMKKIESRFPMDEYMRIHRSYIVRIDSIIDIQDDTISCLDKIIPIGKTYKSSVLQRLNRL